MTTKDQHKDAPPAHEPPATGHDTAAPSAAPAKAPAPPPPPKIGRKLVGIAVDSNSSLLIAACVDGTVWSYGLGSGVAHPQWNQFPIIQTDEDIKAAAAAAAAPPPTTPDVPPAEHPADHKAPAAHKAG